MHIKNITIDGFKSYAQRTEVKNFDPFFNAITGLNGSGKSNILDSICFLLGITNLSQVRASSLQDLVYKNGQVGITKATVSITFDNKDQSKSPIGYESYKEITITRQIVIGGKNKYLINGVNAQNSRVADLFRTVGLNVNNPHFLIMQGRVTKVMNMKPPEILSMIEEATGTSMYEQKKISAQKMIHKKETKLQAINNTLDEELQPTLKKLREERAVFMKYQKLQRELERTQKFLLAYKFHIATCHVEGGEEKLMQLTNQKNELAKKAGQLHDQREQLVNLIESQEGICSEEAEKALRELSEQLLEVQKTEAKVQSKLKNQQEQLKSDMKDLKFVEKTARDCENELAKKNKALEDKLLTCQKSQEEFKSQELAHTNAQKKFQAISAGLAIADDGEEASWKQQLLNTNNKISDLNTAIKQTRMKLNHTRAQLKSKQAELKKLGRSSTNETRLLKEAEGNLQKVQKQMQAIHYRENEYEELCNTKHNLDGQLNQLYNERSNLHSKMKLEFDFRNPDRNFDRSRVKGLVAELFTVTHNENTTALEVTGGGRLFNVVVDTSSTSQLLIDRRCTKGRTTYIPIDKMPGHRLSQNIIDKAKRLVGAANVDLALDLIDYDPALENAMRFVFGSTLVCTDIEIAAKLAYHPEIKCKTVSLDGQVVNPSGSLSGGSKPTSYLWAFTKNREIKRQILDIEHQLKALEKSLIQANEGRDRYFKLKPKLSQYEVEIENLKARLVNTSQAKLQQQCNDLSNDKDQQSELLLQSEKELVEATEKSEELQRKIEDAPAEREKELKKAEQEVERSRKMVEKMRKKFDDNEEILNTLKLEIQELESEVAGSSEKVEKAKQVIVDCEKKIEELTSILKEENSKVEACSKTMEDHRNKLREARREMGRLTQQLKQLEKENDKLKEHNQDIEEKIGKAGDDKRNAIKTVQDLLRDCEWMESEKENFGVSGTIYDFKENDPKEANKKYSKLKVDVEKLEKTVNVKAMQLLDKCEVKCNELLEKKRIVESDKSRIEKTIFELDQMKNEAVTQAYAQVNKNFGSIFSTLLPGATAKLSPMEGCSVLAGLEFRVGFGDVWKSNLNELSGGQRSLVALSLILALLLLKPAPIYILDEVDAALDLSHTQNIGRMLKDHFRHSQFVVVSLKDGMFDNANVLFRTKFVDGVSTVSRVSK